MPQWNTVVVLMVKNSLAISVLLVVVYHGWLLVIGGRILSKSAGKIPSFDPETLLNQILDFNKEHILQAEKK
jgi:hypothetical protein